MVSRDLVQDQLCIYFMVGQINSDLSFCLLSIYVASLRFYQEDDQHNQDWEVHKDKQLQPLAHQDMSLVERTSN